MTEAMKDKQIDDAVIAMVHLDGIKAMLEKSYDFMIASPGAISFQGPSVELAQRVLALSTDVIELATPAGERITEEEIINSLDTRSSGALRHIADQCEIYIKGRFDDGVCQ